MILIDGKEYFDSKEACEYLSIGDGRLKELYYDGKLKDKKMFEKFLYYSKDEIIDFQENRRKIIDYKKKWFTGRVLIKSDHVLLEGVEYRTSEYMPNYYISKKGDRVFKKIENSFLELVTTQDKHKHRTITVKMPKSKTVMVHRLVLESFGFPKPNPDAVVRHKDDDPDNNNFDNLKWGTQKENVFDFMQHHYIDKLLRIFIQKKYPEIYEEFSSHQKTVRVRGNRVGGLTISLDEYNKQHNPNEGEQPYDAS